MHAPTAILALVLLVSTAEPALAGMPDAQDPARIELAVRSAKLADGSEVAFELGTLLVPENRDDAQSRTIGVGFARIPAAVQPPPSPPVFLLPGGPGSSYVDALVTDDERQVSRALAGFCRYRGFADLVLVDQRGFSTRGDRWTVTLPTPERLADRPWTVADSVAQHEAFARSTVADFATRGVDLRGYTVVQCAHDVADLSRALGYAKVTLQGTSFGSQWSFAVMRLHPDIVARALLSGVEPLDHGFDMPGHVFAAVQRMWRAVEQDRRFRRYLPFEGEGAMAEAARVVIERLEREPIVVKNDDDSATIVVLGPDDFPWYDPAMILELHHGRTARWRLQSAMHSALGGGRERGVIGPLIDTSLGVTPARRYRLWNDPAVRYVRRSGFAAYLATADIWPSPDIGDELRTPVLSEIPVVFAQGDWDVQTPVENVLEIAPYFVNGRVLIAERGGHGVLEPIAHERPEVWAELVEFLRDGDMEAIPARIELEPSRRFAPPTFVAPSR